MERLKIVLIIAAMVATARTSPGQQATRSSSSNADHAQPTFVVIGDVRNHNYFVLSPHARTTIHQAVIQAGMLGDSVSVSVLRGKQQRAAFTQMVSGASTDTGELVMEGDVLVVQSMQPIQETHQKNAALRTDGGVVPVTLADEFIAVGDVLHLDLFADENELGIFRDLLQNRGILVWGAQIENRGEIAWIVDAQMSAGGHGRVDLRGQRADVIRAIDPAHSRRSV